MAPAAAIALKDVATTGSVDQPAEPQELAEGRRAVRNYFRLTPVLWFLGLLAPAGALLLAVLPLRRWPRGRLVNWIVFLWISVGLAQLFAAFVNSWLMGNPVSGTLRNAVSMGTLGWVFAGLAIAAGHAYALTDRRTVRATVTLGVYILLLSAVAGAASSAGMPSLMVRTLLGLPLPDSPAVRFYFTAIFYILEDSFGEVATRLVLFFPWATALAMGGIAIAVISLQDPSRFWRYAGFSGGLVGVVFSWSRIGMAAFLIAMAVQLFFRLDGLARSLAATLGLFALLGLLLSGFDPVARLTEMRSAVDAARSGSSMARELIYEKSWEGFVESPVVGHGWIGESVHKTENLPIGSHSTVYGLLYTGGALTFGMFVLALGTTLVATIWAALGRDESGAGRVALGLALTLLVFCKYEMLFSFTLPCLFLFTWIGGTLREISPRSDRAVRD